MPVIQLPRDTRWSEIGEGLNKGLTALVEGYQDKQASQGVAQIMEDPNIADTKKSSAIFKQFGSRGMEKYKEAITAQVLQATVEQKKADAMKDLATVGASTLRDKMMREALGLPPAATPTATPTATPSSSTALGAPAPSVTADVLSGAAPSAPTALSASPAAAAPAAAAPAAIGTGNLVSDIIDQRAAAGRVTITPAEKAALTKQVTLHMVDKAGGLADISAPIDKFIAEKQKGDLHAGAVAKQEMDLAAQRSVLPTVAPSAQASLTTAQGAAAAAPYTAPKAAAETQTAEQTAAANAPVKIPVEQVAQSFPTFSPEQSQAVSAAGQSGGSKAAVAEITKIVDANAKGAGVSEGTAKFLRETASYGSITERFAREMAAAPEKLGLLSGSGLRARAESYGLPVGDPQLLSMLNSQKLAAATAARDTGNFGVSATNVTLSKQTSANIDKTAMSNVMMFAGAAAQKLKEAEVEKALYVGNPRAQAAIDQAVQPWKNIQQITDSLTSYVDTSKAVPGVNERDVTYFMGNQVDPNSMRALVRQDSTEYKVKPQGTDKRTSYTGADIFGMARAAGIDPAAMLIRLGGKP